MPARPEVGQSQTDPDQFKSNHFLVAISAAARRWMNANREFHFGHQGLWPPSSAVGRTDGDAAAR